MKRTISSRPSIAILTGAFIVTCFSISAPSTLVAQGLDDLFAQPNDTTLVNLNNRTPSDPVDEIGEDETDRGSSPTTEPPLPSRVPDSVLSEAAPRSSSDLKLVDSPGSRSGVNRSRPSAMDLRQARAMAESRARAARLEATRWGLRPGLRPTWPSAPMSTSRFPSGRTLVVPVYGLVR